MRKQVITYVKPAAELKKGDRILASRMTVVEVEAVDAFNDSSKRPCIEVTHRQRGQASVLIFLADEFVLVVE